jgi:hypothetical protein
MGRKRLYQTEDEKKQAQREHGLKYYYRRKALKQALEQGNNSEGVVKITVSEYSKKLGKIEESIEFKKKNDESYLKKRKSQEP